MTLQEFRQRYQYIPERDLLGKGGFAKVYKALDVVENRTVALKFYQGNPNDKYGVMEELRKAVTLSHPNLIRYFNAVQLQNDASSFEDEGIQVAIVEYANSGDFNDFILSFPDTATILKVVRGILKGLDYLHQHGIVHRDIKPQNLLMHRAQRQWDCKIADFGLAKRLEGGGQSSKLMGTVEYMAPEQFNVKKFGINEQLGTNVDLWSLGVILYELFTGSLPFGNTKEGADHREVMVNIMEKELTDMKNIMEPFRSVIKACLVKSATQRAATAKEVLAILEGHPLPTPKKAANKSNNNISKNNKRATFEIPNSLLIAGNLIFTPLFGFILFFFVRNRTIDDGTEILKVTFMSVIAWVILIVLFFLFVMDVV